MLTLPAADDCGETALTLLDTPGHVDFSAEAERALQVLDYAVLVVSGTDGVQAHTETLWKLLARYRVPTFVLSTKWICPARTLLSACGNCGAASATAVWIFRRARPRGPGPVQ